jgi:hypothetical protein
VDDGGVDAGLVGELQLGDAPVQPQPLEQRGHAVYGVVLLVHLIIRSTPPKSCIVPGDLSHMACFAFMQKEKESMRLTP